MFACNGINLGPTHDNAIALHYLFRKLTLYRMKLQSKSTTNYYDNYFPRSFNSSPTHLESKLRVK
jgi:hypothetical protein